jgi:hypothetical protein
MANYSCRCGLPPAHSIRTIDQYGHDLESGLALNDAVNRMAVWIDEVCVSRKVQEFTERMSVIARL